MPKRALVDLQEELIDEVDGPGRYADVALALTRAKTKETLLYAGGRWDKLEKRFSRQEPESCAVVELEESQVEFARWFARFLADFRDGRPRAVSLALAAGDRRGGKTFDAFFCQVAALVDVPLLPDGLPTIGWVISRTYRERDELDQLMAGYVPRRYYHHRRAPEHRFDFAHGSYLRNLSADEPDSLKQGRVDFLLYNEPQKMSPRAVKNGLYGTSDRGGLCVLAANPPSDPSGEWLLDLKEAIEEDPEVRPIAVFFGFSSKDNTRVDQPARQRVARLARCIEPDMADVDAEGAWRRWGELAYPAWNSRPLERGGLVGDPPASAVDATARVTMAAFGAAFHHVIGGDFQRRPQAAAVLRAYELPDVDGLVYWFMDECGVKGTEIELSTELMGAPHGYVPTPYDERSAVWVGDCSGSFQGAERVKGRTSFGLLESEGWRVFPAEVIRLPGKNDHPKNPDVGQRLGLMYRLMQARRVRVSASCVWLLEAFAKCQLRRTETGRRVPKGMYAHVTDAASYAIWRLEPRPIAPRRPPSPSDVRAVARLRGVSFFSS